MGHGRLAPDDLLSGTYRIVRLIGKGGVGEVYEAVHDRLVKKRFAVKVLLEELAGRRDVIDRFRREADILSELGHPNIVQISDFAQTPDGVSYLVMELVEGLDLAEELRLHGSMPPAKAADIIGQLASALDAVHSRGIIHRDLKPQNVVLARRPGETLETAKILDFGIAKVREATIALTQQDAILGTPQYMAPEQASGKLGEIDERTDQFSLAAIAYELVNGAAPFVGPNPAIILYKVVHEDPSPFRLPLPATEAAILRGLAKNKAMRFPSVREFHQALAEAAATDTWPPPAVHPTLVEAESADEAAAAGVHLATASLPAKNTTLSRAAMNSKPGLPPESSGRRWSLPVLLLVAVTGVSAAVAAWWPRHGDPKPASVPPVTHPVTAPVPLPAQDASVADTFAHAIAEDLPQPPPAGKPAVPAVHEPSAPTTKKAAGKKKTKIRNEDL